MSKGYQLLQPTWLTYHEGIIHMELDSVQQIFSEYLLLVYQQSAIHDIRCFHLTVNVDSHKGRVLGAKKQGISSAESVIIYLLAEIYWQPQNQFLR